MGLFDKKEALTLIITTVVLALLVYFADIQQILNSIAKVDNSFIGLGVVLGFTVLLHRSAVWYLILNKLELQLGYCKTFKIFSASELLNNITPFGQTGGQPFMAYIISKNTGINYEKSLTAVLSAETLNGTCLATFGLASVAYFLSIGKGNSAVYDVALFSLIGLTVFLSLLYLVKRRMKELKAYSEGLFLKLKFLEKWEDKIRKRAKGIEETLEFCVEDHKQLIKPLIFGHLAYLTEFTILGTYLILLGYESSLLYLFLVFPLANIAKSAPTSGGTGVYEFAMASIIHSLSSIGFTTALAAVFLYRISTYWNAIVVGYISFQLLNYKRQ